VINAVAFGYRGRSMLNLNQKKALRLKLGLLEDELRRLRRLLQKGEGQKLLLQIVDDLTEVERNLLDERIDRLNSHAIRLKNSFDLPKEGKVVRQIVKTTSAYLSVQMEEIISDRLRGHGEITPEVKETLDPILIEIISILRQMESIV
jgi:hypothetical protein